MTDASAFALHVEAAKQLLRELHEHSAGSIDPVEGKYTADLVEQLVQGLGAAANVVHRGNAFPATEKARVDLIANQYAATTKPGRSRTISVTG